MIRKATLHDLDRLMEIYDGAKAFMVRSGNPDQWIDGYPQRSIIVADIENGYCHVWDECGIIHAVFALIPGEDPTYARIDDGQWLNSKPYAVVHRLAGDGLVANIGQKCLEWCFTKFPNIRVDTHSDNYVMQRILCKMEFCRCGIIHTHNGTPRIAYQKDLSE